MSHVYPYPEIHLASAEPAEPTRTSMVSAIIYLPGLFFSVLYLGLIIVILVVACLSTPLA